MLSVQFRVSLVLVTAISFPGISIYPEYHKIFNPWDIILIKIGFKHENDKHMSYVKNVKYNYYSSIE